ncbi:elongin C [Sorochytrium milnesiophthora]
MSAAATAASDTVRLLSSDGFEFVIDRKCAMASGTIKSMLSSPGRFTESQQNLIEFKDIKAIVLEKVCQYLYYRVRYTNSTSEIPDFKLEPDYALEVLMVAEYLDV